MTLGNKIITKDVTDFLDMATALLILGNGAPASLIYDIVHIPFEVFTSASLKIATNVWLTIITEKPEVAHLLLVEVCYCWMRSIDDNIGLYSRDHDLKGEEYQKWNIPLTTKQVSTEMQKMHPKLCNHIFMLLNFLLPISRAHYFKVTFY